MAGYCLWSIASKYSTHRYDYDEGHRDVYDFAGLRLSF